MVVPNRYTLVSHTVLAEGYGVEAVVREGAEDQCLVAAYLPPGEQAGAWAALRPSLLRAGCSAPPLYLGGDLNVQPAAPRAGEEAVVATIVDDLAHCGSVLLDGPRETFRGRRGSAAIDVAAAPRAVAWRWGVQAQWSRHLSTTRRCLSDLGLR